MSEGSRKRAATSPLSSEFDKKSKLGLSHEELSDLNEHLRYTLITRSQTLETYQQGHLRRRFEELLFMYWLQVVHQLFTTLG